MADTDSSGTLRPELIPPRDATFDSLLEQAHAGTLPVFKVVASTAFVRRFDQNFKPELTEVGVQVMATYLQMASEGTLRLSPLLVYPQAQRLIVPDNYFTLAVVEALGLDTVMCLVLGEPSGIELLRKDGPLNLEAVRSQVRAVASSIA